MQVETASENDVYIIKQQLGCKKVHIGGILSRCEFGYPQIMLLNPLSSVDEKVNINYQALSNVIWLTCPYLNDKIHELENIGLISRVTDFIQNDDELSSMMEGAHANFYHLRNSVYAMYGGCPEEETNRVFTRGIGGIYNLQTLKCLHLHFCHYRIYNNNVAGRITYHLLDGKLSCNNGECKRRCFQGIEFSHDLNH